MNICCADCKSNYYNENKELVCEATGKIIIHNPPANIGEEMGDVPCWCPLMGNHEPPEKCFKCNHEHRIGGNGGLYGYECVFTHKYTIIWVGEHKFVKFDKRPDWCPFAR